MTSSHFNITCAGEPMTSLEKRTNQRSHVKSRMTSRPFTAPSGEYRSCNFVHPNLVQRDGSSDEITKYLKQLLTSERKRRSDKPGTRQRASILTCRTNPNQTENTQDKNVLSPDGSRDRTGQFKGVFTEGIRILATNQRHRLVSEAESDGATEFTPFQRQQLRHQLAVVFRVTRVIIAWCRAMREQSMQFTHVTGVTQLYFYSATGTDAGDKDAVMLAFDKSEYSRHKGIRLPLAVRRAATKEPHERSAYDLTVIYKTLNSLKSFKERYPEALKQQICKVAWYMSCEKGRVIVRQGHVGLNFYFIYSGSAFIQLETEVQETGETKVSVESVIGPGTSFGELALLEKEGRRTVSVICRQPTELFQIDREAFREICSDMYKDELRNKVTLARRYPLFASLSDDTLSRICFQSLVLSIPTGSVIEKDWSQAKHIYIVVEGSVTLLSQLDTSTISNEALEEATIPYPGNLLTRLSHWTDAQDRPNTSHACRAETVPERARTKKLHYVTLGTLYKFGHSDFRILDARAHRQMEPVILVSQGTKVLRMSKNLVQQLIPKHSLENYIRSVYKPPEIPDRDTLMQRFLRMKHWRDFRSRICSTVKREIEGDYVAMIPENRKLFNNLKVIK